jgi:surface protein
MRSLTLSFFSTSQYHDHYSCHDDLEKYHVTITSTLSLQKDMFFGATSFNQNLSTWDVSSADTFVSGLGA